MYLKILFLFYSMVTGNRNGKEIMRSVADTFGRTVFECQDEMHFDSSTVDNIFRYWHQHPLEDRDMGCIYRCILLKLELVDGDGTLNVANADGFFKANGADDEMTSDLIELYHYCYEAVSVSQDDCMWMLEMGKCCREGVINAHWSPVAK